MITFIQFLITGLRLGSVYALIALGYTMVYGIIKLINFAHGDFIMVGGYSLFFIIPVMMAAGIPGWLAVVPAVLICACVGMLVELLAYRPVRKTGNNLTCLITAIAMSFELAGYGLFSGLLYRLLPKKTVNIYVSLIGAMILGRIIWGIAMVVISGVTGSAFTWSAFMAGALLNAIPGIILHIVLIPILVMALKRAKVLDA